MRLRGTKAVPGRDQGEHRHHLEMLAPALQPQPQQFQIKRVEDQHVEENAKHFVILCQSNPKEEEHVCQEVFEESQFGQ